VTAIARTFEVWLAGGSNPTVLFDSPTLAVLAERLLDPVYQVEGSPAAVEGMSEAELDAALAQLLTEGNATEQVKEKP